MITLITVYLLYITFAYILFILCTRDRSAVPKPTAQDRAEAKTAVEALLNERMPR